MTQMITKIKSYSYLNSTILPFIKEHGDRRIRKDTINHYKNFCLHKQDSDEIIIVEVRDSGTLVAVSLATIRNNVHVMRSLTVTNSKYRKSGFGSNTLQQKLEALKAKGLGIRTTVAEDNVPSMQLCKKVGLIKAEVVQKERLTGFYNAVIWIDPPHIAE